MNNTKKLTQYLRQYGTNIENWPKNLRAMGLTAAKYNDEFKQVLNQEKAFDTYLKNRMQPAYPHQLADSIISQTKHMPQHTPWLWSELTELFNAQGTFFKPVYALSFSLIIGLVVGMGMDNQEISTSQLASEDVELIQNYLYDSEDIYEI